VYPEISFRYVERCRHGAVVVLGIAVRAAAFVELGEVGV
jgi:hypothetical protein